MIIALALMSRVLWPKELIGEQTTVLPQNTMIRSKRKVVCMLICACLHYVGCLIIHILSQFIGGLH
ncbi:tachykinin receptor-like protein [Euroglyphus maynei]|uniref:Tachykinin receptor-like protein n=1 Tax=Euroglyphus maynei TaxID=6958 RepID=A0A1Y3BIY2_EURMA|nr:tachykinin receptor-like protein [Euroglyphus maynei]